MRALQSAMNKRKRFTIGAAVILFAAAGLTLSNEASGQTAPQRLALKDGESIELYPVYYVSHCKSIMIGLPEIEILEGPPEVSLNIREEPVLPRRQGCASKVDGGTLMLTAKGVNDKIEANLVYRVKYRTKDGPRETSSAYLVSLFP
jgi:hypothetical protein